MSKKYKTYNLTDYKLKWFLSDWDELVRAADYLKIKGSSAYAVSDRIYFNDQIEKMFQMQAKELVKNYFEIEEHEVEDDEE